MGLNEIAARKERREVLKELLLIMMQVIIISKIIITFILYVGYVPTGSMTPTIGVGDKIVVWRLGTVLDKETKGIKHGDMVVFDHEDEVSKDFYVGEPPTTQMVKRVIALGGDTIQIDEGRVYVNGAEIDEEYVEYQNIFYMPKTVVPEREMFLLGDNRANSYDSRLWAEPTISIENVRGKIWFIIPGLRKKQ